MGWWRIGGDESGEDMIGDGPADAFGEMLQRFARSGLDPSAQELLDAFADALHERAADLIQDPASLGDRPLVARFPPPVASLRSGAATRATRPRALDAHVRKGLADVTYEYEEAESRKPRLRELLHAIRFSFRDWMNQRVAARGPHELIDFAVGDKENYVAVEQDGWWTIEGDEVTGEPAIEALAEGFRDVAREAGRKPRLGEALDVIGDQIRTTLLGGENDPALPGLVARFADGSKLTAATEWPVPLDLQVGVPLLTAFSTLVDAYQAAQGRPPRPREVLESLAYLLRVNPGELIADAPAAKLIDIVPAEEGKP